MSQARAALGKTDPDSRARTHLANERTFLAWLRTGLSLIAVGLAAANFLPLDLIPHVPYVTFLSLLLVVAGTAMIAYGAFRFASATRAIDNGEFAPAPRSIVAVALVVTILGAMTLPIVLLLR